MQSIVIALWCFSLIVTKNVWCRTVPEKEFNLVPLADGSFQYLNSSELKSQLENVDSDFEVTFWLFTKQNPKSGQKIPIFDHNALKTSHFNLKHPTRFIIHGWLNNRDSAVNDLIRNAYLNRGNFNVFIVDWSSIASSKLYSNAQNKVDVVGKKVAEFLDFLHYSVGEPFNQLYVIGHSLGAHVSGFAGKFVKKGKINTIIGLDPALPLFSINSPENRLSKTDAEYVETIQTNGGKLGFHDPIGTASFYPNWGKKQSGCGVDASGSCSHSRSYQYFAESIGTENKFVVTKCKNFDEIKNGKCSDGRKKLKMGGEPSNHGKANNGIYYLETNSKKPFGKG